MNKKLYTIKEFIEKIGYYSEEDVWDRIQSGMWREWREYIRAPDKSILISLPGIHKWIYSGTKENNGH